MGVLQRFWTKHRLATVLCLALLFLGLLLQPWSLVLVLAVGFGGPLLKRLDCFKESPINSWRRDHWIVVALVLSVVLLALTGGSSGRGALILALLPVAWVLVTDRSLLQDHKQIERGSTDEPLAPSTTDAEEAENNTEPPEPLVGAELLAKVKELGDVGKSDLVRACGYLTIKEDGSERINFTGFYEALLEAKGVGISASTSDSYRGVESNSSDEEPSNLPSAWNDLETHEIVDQLRDLDEVEADILTTFASSEDWRLRQAVAWHDKTPEDVLKKLADDDDSDVSQAATRDRDLPKLWRFMGRVERIEALKADDVALEILELFANSEDWRLREAVAQNRSVEEEILNRLKDDDDCDVASAARNSLLNLKLPKEWRLFDDDDLIDQLKERTVPVDVLQLLAISSNWRIRQAVARHDNTPDDLLNQLAEDTDSDVKQAIEDRRLPIDWRNLDDDERIEKLTESVVPLEVLELLSKSGNWSVRQAVARNQLVEEGILNRLKDDDDCDVASAARDGLLNRKLPEEWRLLDDSDRIVHLKAKSVPVDVLELLANSANWEIRQAVAKHEDTPDTALNQLAEDTDSDVKQAIEDRRLPVKWRNLDDDERITAIETGSASIEIFEILSKSNSWRVRQAVASSINAPMDILKGLSYDSDADVKCSAKETLIQSALPEEWKKLSETEKVERLTRHSADIEVLELLALSSSVHIRNAVALNRNASIPVLLKMRDDRSTGTRINNLIRRTWAINGSGLPSE